MGGARNSWTRSGRSHTFVARTHAPAPLETDRRTKHSHSGHHNRVHTTMHTSERMKSTGLSPPIRTLNTGTRLLPSVLLTSVVDLSQLPINLITQPPTCIMYLSLQILNSYVLHSIPESKRTRDTNFGAPLVPGLAQDHISNTRM